MLLSVQIALYVRSIEIQGRSTGIEPPFCGATLIAPSWLVTAAHCLSELIPDRDLPIGQLFSVEEELEQSIRASIGDHIRGHRDGPHEVSRLIEYAIIHPDYRKGFSERGFDIALLKLEKPVEFGRLNIIDHFNPNDFINKQIMAVYLLFIMCTNETIVYHKVFVYFVASEYVHMHRNSFIQLTLLLSALSH